jgi:hypothetical protein
LNSEQGCSGVQNWTPRLKIPVDLHQSRRKETVYFSFGDPGNLNHSKTEKTMSTFYKKAALICAAAAAGAVLCAMPISVERSAISGIVLSIDQAQARVGHPGSAVSVAGVNRRHRRAARRCATGVTC